MWIAADDNRSQDYISKNIEFLNNNFTDLNWWDGERNNNKDGILESAETNITVNKININPPKYRINDSRTMLCSTGPFILFHGNR